jgi:uncharacterized protein
MLPRRGCYPQGQSWRGGYPLVENSEGVWISRSNRNIESVIRPTLPVNGPQQESLNIDALTGKSIRAIRCCDERGPATIWGARTFDGNSLDWRYISERQLLNMVEQTVANAAFVLVFETNDASTWATCSAMISRFLHMLWKAGALQGALPEEAFSVSVGLDKTMTPEDILDGIMRVEVKVAVERPAEFIEITYEQQIAKT